MTLSLVFKKRRVATLPELVKKLEVSGRSVLRHLKAEGYYSSYTHNSRYYTLKSIPRFDRNWIWMHRNIGFTRLNSLYDLIVRCVDRSAAGYSAVELSKVVHTRVANQLGVLTRGARFQRIRFTEGHVYFSLDPGRFHRQLSVRRKQWHMAAPMEPEQALGATRLPGGLSHEEIVLVLVEMIQNPRMSLKGLAGKLHDKNLDVPELALRELVDAYQLDRYKKKEHRLLIFLLEHLAAVRGQNRWEEPNKVIEFIPVPRSCPECKEKLRRYKTQSRPVYSIEYGNFTAKVRYTYCATHRYDPEAPERVRSYRAKILAKVVGRSRRYAYDVISYVGISRFLQGRQVKEICADLNKDYHIPLSESHAGHLSDEFLIRLSCLHTSYRHHLKRLIKSRGGYVLHIDTSCEDKSSAVLVGLDGRTGWVLVSEKIPSEREEFIVPALKQLNRAFGPPRSIMRDMGKAMANAATTVFAGIPQRICHFHFLKDVGKDILKNDYQSLRSLMIEQKVAPQLNALRRDLLGPLKKHKPDPRVLEDLLAGRRRMTRKIYKSVDVLLVVSMVDWILNYPQDGSGLGFPFDHSYRYFYERCRRAYNLVLKLQTRVSSTVFKDARLDTMVFALAKVCDPAYEAAETLKSLNSTYAARLSQFIKLRRVMRFYCDSKAPLSQELGFASIDEIREANKSLKKFLREKKRQLKNDRHPARRTALKIIIEHLEKHWDYLTVPTKSAGKSSQRTNNAQERMYRSVKARMRRCTGKKDVSREFDRLGAHIPLVQNLENPSYVEAVLGSIENLPEALADLDPVLVAEQTERFYEDRHGPGYRLRKSIDPIQLLISSC